MSLRFVSKIVLQEAQIIKLTDKARFGNSIIEEGARWRNTVIHKNFNFPPVTESEKGVNSNVFQCNKKCTF